MFSSVHSWGKQNKTNYTLKYGICKQKQDLTSLVPFTRRLHHPFQQLTLTGICTVRGNHSELWELFWCTASSSSFSLSWSCKQPEARFQIKPPWLLWLLFSGPNLLGPTDFQHLRVSDSKTCSQTHYQFILFCLVSNDSLSEHRPVPSNVNRSCACLCGLKEDALFWRATRKAGLYLT